MARRISLEPHLIIEELEGRDRSTKDSVTYPTAEAGGRPHVAAGLQGQVS